MPPPACCYGRTDSRRRRYRPGRDIRLRLRPAVPAPGHASDRCAGRSRVKPAPAATALQVHEIRRADREPSRDSDAQAPARPNREWWPLWPSFPGFACAGRSEEHTSELQSLAYVVCRLLLEKKKKLVLASVVATKQKNQKQLGI